MTQDPQIQCSIFPGYGGRINLLSPVCALTPYPTLANVVCDFVKFVDGESNNVETDCVCGNSTTSINGTPISRGPSRICRRCIKRRHSVTTRPRLLCASNRKSAWRTRSCSMSLSVRDSAQTPIECPSGKNLVVSMRSGAKPRLQ